MKKTQSRHMKKRIFSAALALGMVLSMLPSDGIEAAATRIVSNAAKGDVTYEYNNYTNSKTVTRERKAVKDISSDGIITDPNQPKGSVENPYVILEVVPYKDFASFGYLVDGCEPINMNTLRGNKNVIDTLTGSDGDFFGYGKFVKPAGEIVFFPDEEEGNINFYQNTNLTAETITIDGVDINSHESALRYTTDQWDAKKKTEAKSVFGYYEVVPKGEGKFVLKTETAPDAEGHDVTTRSIVKADSSNQSEATLIWHTTNPYVINQYRAEGVNTSYLYLSLNNLNNPVAFPLLQIDQETHVGNRFYTQRFGGDSDPYYDVTGDYYIYQSNDLFAKNTLGLSDAEAKKCSITVKTITAAELNKNYEETANKNKTWVGIADVIYFNADLTVYKEVSGSDTDGKDDTEAGLIDLWQSTDAVSKTYMNRFQYGNMLDDTGAPDSVKGFRGIYDFDHIPKLGPTKNSTLRDEDNYLNKSREISLDVFYKILDRVSRSEDYVALIFDQNVTKPEYNDMTSANVTYSIYKLGDKKEERGKAVGGGMGSPGYKTNVAKLWLSCASANPGLVKRFMIDDGPLSNHNQITYGEGTNEKIIVLSKDNSRTGISDDERLYWSGYTFFCAEKSFNRTTDKESYWRNYAGDASIADATLADDCYYVQGHVFVTPSGKNLVEDYVKTYSDSELAFAATKYLDFNEFLEEYGGSVSRKANVATSSLATKYVLDPDKVVNYYLDELTVLDIEPSVKMKSGKQTGDGAYDWSFSTNDVIKLIPKRMGSETRVKSIVHQVMPSFIAKNDDLNSTYDLIYFGDDAGGFWTGDEVKKAYYNNGSYNGAKAGNNRTDFVDDNMDGLVYFHLGDKLNIASSSTRAYNYQADAEAFGEKTYSRQSGNDLTEKKKVNLLDYLNAGYPIVIADNLYPGNWGTTASTRPYVQKIEACVMYRFVRDCDPERNKDAEGNYSNCYFTKNNLEQIDKMISNRMKGRVIIGGGPNDLPTTYDTNKPAGSALYLDDHGTGYAKLHFKVTVPNTTDYEYRVFVDRNRDSNFTASSDDEKNEVITNGYKPLTRLVNEFDVPMPEKWVGFVQWRIEVVNKANHSKRYSQEGCSAVAADPRAAAGSDRAKKKIVALQIMPTHNSQKANNSYENSNSWVDLSNRNWDGSVKGNGTWQGLYNQVTDFDIEVVAITWRQFNQLFKPATAADRFVFHMGSTINISNDATGNPKKSIIDRVEKRVINFYTNDAPGHKKDEWRDVTGTAAANYYRLEDFNMIVLGFDDAFGLTDMSNENGCVEYLYYFTQKGCSILFTHDTTSQHSAKSKNAYQLGWVDITNHESDWHEVRPFGYTGNNMMREIMGMNRYMQYSKNIGDSRDTKAEVNFRTDLKTDIQAYVTSKITYDGKNTTNLSGIDGLHGFSMFNLMRYVGAGASDGKNGRVQYKYMVMNPNVTDIRSNSVFDNGGAFSIDGSRNNIYNNITEVVTQINEGQITQYPFTIGDGFGGSRQRQFKVGQTHGQWWQLNMEDEDLTVWYTLDDPANSSLFSSGSDNAFYANRNSKDGRNDLIYSAVPYDAANNFYIFSKGNIFYSGVGHSALESTDPKQYERKLFVNTLVAAYRPKFGLPFIQVTSTEATLTSNLPRMYSITLPMDYKYDADDHIDWDNSEILLGSGSSDFLYGNDVIVKFKAMDNNGCATIYTYARYLNADIRINIYDSLTSAKGGSPMPTTRHVDFDDGHSEDYCELVVGQEYYIRFPKGNLNGYNTVWFRSYNSRVTTEERDETYLQFNSQPLFKLD